MAVRSLPPYESNRDNYIYVTDVTAFVNEVLDSPPTIMAVDTETYYEPMLKAPMAITKWIQGSRNNCPFGVSLYWGDTGYWIDHDLYALKPLLECPAIAKVAHNLKYDMMMLSNIGITLGGDLHDTVGMIHLIDENMECKIPELDENGKHKVKRSKKLKDLGYHFFGADAHELEDLVAEYRSIIAANRGISTSDVSYKDVSDENQDLMKDYAIFDTELCYRLYFKLLPQMDVQELWGAYRIDMEATKVVLEIERNGYRVDQVLMRKYEKDLATIITRRTNRVNEIAGREFNLNSAAELVRVYEELGVKWHWFTPKEEYNTDKKVLKYLLGHSDPVVAELSQLVLEYRKADKLLSTYISGLFEYIQDDGKIHCDFWIYPDDFGRGGTRTGRMSSSSPNFQNIPKKPFKMDEFDFNIRSIFIADEGYTLVFMDADQQEYRLLAHYGRDESFMRFVHEGKDIHSATASLIHNVPYEEVTDEQRNDGKTTNFALVYGLGNPAFAKALGYRIDEDRIRNGTRSLYSRFKPWKLPPYNLTETPLEVAFAGIEDEVVRDGIEYFYSEEAQAALRAASDTKKKYFAQFPGIKQFIKDAGDAAAARGYIKTWVGSRRHFKDAKKESYKAPNACIQGGCGYVLKDRLPHVRKALDGTKSKIVNLVHDEAAFLIHNEEMHLLPILNCILSDLPFRVPITWGIDIGQSWGAKREYDENEEYDEEEAI